MFILFLCLSLLTLAEGQSWEDFNGKWTEVRSVYYGDYNGGGIQCTSVELEVTPVECKAGKETARIVRFLIEGSLVSQAVSLLKKTPDQTKPIKTKFNCEDDFKPDPKWFMLFQYINDNYVIIYVIRRGYIDGAMLMAKRVPPEEDLEEFTENLKDEVVVNGTVQCTKEILEEMAKKVTVVNTATSFGRVAWKPRRDQRKNTVGRIQRYARKFRY